MEARLKKWGNSLALRIPKALADQLRLREDSPVYLTLHDGQLVIAPADEGASLESLLAEVTPANLHGETDTGPAMGHEAW